MSLYVRVYNSFYSHRKTLRLSLAIGSDAFWVPPRLWSYASENEPSGIFKDYTAEELALLIGYKGDAKAMLEALLNIGFMDADPLRIHDWGDHNGYHKKFSNRGKTAARARWKGKEKKGDGEEKRRKEASNASIMLQASRSLIQLLNEKTGRTFSETATYLKLIRARLDEPGVTVEGCRQMIERQCARWLGTDQEEYLRPVTLFNKSKFDGYYAAKDLPATPPQAQLPLPVVPVFAQIKAVEAQLADVDKQLRAISHSAPSVFPERAAEEERQRKPLRERKAQLTEQLRALTAQQANPSQPPTTNQGQQ